MKKVTLFATFLALALGASAQESHSVGPNVISLNARGHERANATGVTTIQAPNARSVDAAAKSGLSGGSQGPPVAKQGPNAIPGPTAVKIVGPAAR